MVGLAFKQLNRQRQMLLEAVRKAAIGAALLQLAVPFAFIALVLLLAAIFLSFAHLSTFILPAVWTGLITLGLGIVISLFGFQIMKG